MICSFLPDLDVVAFRLGIPYHAPWGHRGAIHSIGFAVLMGITAGLLAAMVKRAPWRVASVVAVVTASHGVLDTLTDGGLGIALLWPLSNTRFFAPVRPIPVAPIGSRMLSPRGIEVMAVELLLFLPIFLYALWPRARRVEPARPRFGGADANAS